MPAIRFENDAIGQHVMEQLRDLGDENRALRARVRSLAAALQAYEQATSAGVDADPVLWRRARLAARAALAREELAARKEASGGQE